MNPLNRWVVTAAHCLVGNGEITVATEIDAAGIFDNILKVSRKFAHPAYVASTENARPLYDFGD